MRTFFILTGVTVCLLFFVSSASAEKVPPNNTVLAAVCSSGVCEIGVVHRVVERTTIIQRKRVQPVPPTIPPPPPKKEVKKNACVPAVCTPAVGQICIPPVVVTKQVVATPVRTPIRNILGVSRKVVRGVLALPGRIPHRIFRGRGCC